MIDVKKTSLFLFFLCILSIQALASRAEADAKEGYKRIVSLAPSITESLYALDYFDRVVGVTDYDTYPPEVSSVNSVGGNVDPSLEKILYLKPDLVIGERNFHHDLLEHIESFEIDTLELTLHHRLDDVKEAFFEIAKKVGRTDRAEEVWKDIERGLADRRRHTTKNSQKEASMLVVVWHDPLIVAGGWSYIGDIMKAIGIKNAAESKEYSFPAISREELLSYNPDVIFLVRSKKGMSTTVEDFIKTIEGLPIKAKEGSVVSLEAEVLLHPGPRVLESADILLKALKLGLREGELK